MDTLTADRGHRVMAKIKFQVPPNASLNVAGHIYRPGDVFEAERTRPPSNGFGPELQRSGCAGGLAPPA
jgi:hypothetical protein